MYSTLSQISFDWPPVQSISSEKYPMTEKFMLFDENKLGLKRSGKMGVSNHDTNFTSSKQDFGSKHSLKVESDDGIGIHKFFHGKYIFITGATGFLGKVLVEKLLRSTSVGKIFVLVSATDEEAALYKLSKEIIDSKLFKCIREERGKEFVQEKLIPVVGNICEANMGMDSHSAKAIMEEVDVIIGSAANTIFNDRYDFLLDANVNGPQRLMRFAKRCKKLKLFVHISTAYVCGKREGIIYEKPFSMGEHARNCNRDDDETLWSSFPWLDLIHEMNLAMTSCISSSNLDATSILKKLGQERSEYYGWNNQYSMTKALGEMVINEMREDVPVLIMRPSTIESCYKEPLPGWIQGNRMVDPVIISYGKGLLPAYFANPQAVLDFIPVDLVANTTIAAIAKHANLRNVREINVYHVASSNTNQITFSKLFRYMYEYFKQEPLVDSHVLSPVKFMENFDNFLEYTREELFRRNTINGQDEKMTRRIRKQCNAITTYTAQMCKIYEFAGFFNARFHTRNTQKLMEEMSKKEQLEFEVDASHINWKTYFEEIHIPGLKKYVISETI